MSEKPYKPLPDVECLKYHGTPEKPDIKIFVSHRIDLDSETIDNPLYIPVRCGAVFDDREGVTMLGDDTGDNISERRLSFCELTVQYWAWKNVKADYYGLCHYRRYFSFSDETIETTTAKSELSCSGCFVEPILCDEVVSKHAMDREEKIYKNIVAYDMLTVKPFDVSREHFNNILEPMKRPNTYLSYDDMKVCMEIVKEKYPDIYSDALEYLNQKNAYFYNMFIAKKEIFDDLCEFEFSILFELETRINIEHYSETKARVFGYIGEHLTGIFIYHLKKTKRQFHVLDVIPVIFEYTTVKKDEILPAFASNNTAIVLSSSNGYAPYLAVCIKSILTSGTVNNKYDILILERDISKENKAKIIGLSEGYDNVSIRFINMFPYVQGIKFHLTSEGLSQETYYGLLLPYFLKRYKKVITMDCDMIVKRDMAELFQTELRGMLAGAVKDTFVQGMLNDETSDFYSYCTKELALKNPYDYFQAGILLLDLNKFRKTILKDQIIDLLNHRKFQIVDQDIFNMLLQDRVLFLNPKWNHMAMTNMWTLHNYQLAPASTQKLYRDSKRNPYIIHYANVDKPWNDPNIEFADEFWNVARETPFYESLLFTPLAVSINRIQNILGLFDTRSEARKLMDKLLPPGTYRRRFTDFLLPKGSLRWRFCKQIYYIFRPQHRPAKEQRAEEETKD